MCEKNDNEFLSIPPKILVIGDGSFGANSRKALIEMMKEQANKNFGSQVMVVDKIKDIDTPIEVGPRLTCNLNDSIYRSPIFRRDFGGIDFIGEIKYIKRLKNREKLLKKLKTLGRKL
jgi:hypothetical protein